MEVTTTYESRKNVVLSVRWEKGKRKGTTPYAVADDPEKARRIAACLNYLSAFNTEAIEQGRIG